MTNDPRNIFYDQRGISKEDQPQQNQQQPEVTYEEDLAKKVASTISPDGKVSEQEVQEKLNTMKDLAAKYQREGEGQLVNDILNNVLEQKARGQLTNDQLKMFAKRVSPLLNGDQRQRLNALLEQLLKL